MTTSIQIPAPDLTCADCKYFDANGGYPCCRAKRERVWLADGYMSVNAIAATTDPICHLYKGI
jgi:hypothetical protein